MGGAVTGGRGGAVRSIEGGEQRIFAMCSLIYFAHVLRAEAEGLIRLVAGGTAAAIGAKALKEGILFVDVAGGVEGRDSASFVLKMLKVRDEADDSSGGSQRN